MVASHEGRTGPTVKPVIFSTESAQPGGRVEAWREWFYPIFDISAGSGERADFVAKNKVWDIGGILLSGASAPATHVTRGKLNISRAPVDHWVITYNRCGVTTIASDRSALRARAGIPFLWSLGEKTTSERSSVDRLQLMIPRDLFRDIAPLLDASRNSALDNPLGRMLGDYMLFLETRLDSIAREDLPRLRDAVRSMIAACLAPSADRVAAASEEIDLGRRERACRQIHLHLRSATLSPASICKAAGISRTQLYRLFEPSGGVLRYIRRQRLLQSHSVLSDPDNRQSILSIAESFCFEDPSSFSRAFRREFGYSPSDIKSAAAAGISLAAKARTLDSDNRRFGDMLSTIWRTPPKSRRA